MHHIRFRERPWYVQAISIIFSIALIIGIGICISLYYRINRDLDMEYENAQKYCRHIKIDEIEGQDVYLIIFNGDTVGAVSIKR